MTRVELGSLIIWKDQQVHCVLKKMDHDELDYLTICVCGGADPLAGFNYVSSRELELYGDEWEIDGDA